MEQDVIKSYYKSTDMTKDYLDKKKLNYFTHFTPGNTKEYDEIFGYKGLPTVAESFQPGNYKIASNQLASLKYANVDPKIIGFLEIAEADPNLKGKFKVTSLYREGAVTTSGRPSNHSKGLAADIIAVDGNFENLEKTMMANSQLVAYCRANGIGILDEYSKEGRKRNVGSTGPCMHIGPDSLAISDFNKLLQKYGLAEQT